MPTFGIRELGREASKIIRNVEETGEPALVTNHGRLAAAVIPLDADQLEDFVLAQASEFAKHLREAEADLTAGRAVPASDLFAELESRG